MWPPREKDWELVPGHIRDGVRNYVETGLPCGHFVSAVICNDLKGAFMHADSTNQKNMLGIVTFFYNCVPSNAWGSATAMKAWMEKGGLHGFTKPYGDNGKEG